MKANTVSSTKIPCFECIFWNKHADCAPNNCRELTEWLFKQTKKHQQIAEKLRQTVERIKVFERASVK